MKQYIFNSLKEFENANTDLIKLKTFNYSRNFSNIYYYDENHPDNLILVIKQNMDLPNQNIQYFVYIVERKFYEKLIQYRWIVRFLKNKRFCCYTTQKHKRLGTIYRSYGQIFYNNNFEFGDVFKDKNHHVLIEKNINIFTYSHRQKTDIEQSKLIRDQYIESFDEVKDLKLIGICTSSYIYQYDEKTVLILTPYENVYNRIYMDNEDYNIYKNIIQSFHIHRSRNRPVYSRYVYVHINIRIRRLFSKRREKLVPLHRLILKDRLTKKYNMVDHINNNPLDNRRCNLRVATMKINNRNQTVRKNCTSGVTGVRFCPLRNRWLAKRDIYENRNKTPLKARTCSCRTIEEAISCRKILERIPDKAFLSKTPTAKLIEKYRTHGN